ncbi:MAG: hypothetical protein AUK51_02405 [Comamonadaceae bacterium CG2_30_59_20]|nr:MAG: hypothetical protein AUK51_02405 [Comamonadaceae bacterium CG2_30_59_20]
MVPAQPAANAPPERAAAVTTADARVLAILDERWFMGKSLERAKGNMDEKTLKVKLKQDFHGHSRWTHINAYTVIDIFLTHEVAWPTATPLSH